jgi:hypothetical protein
MMAAATSFLKTPRGRLIAWLSAATLVMVGLAAFEVWHEAKLSQHHFTPRPVYPTLDVKLVDAARITIISRMGKVELTRAGNDPKTQIWIMPAAHDYPANRDRTTRLLIGLADLQEIEEKTALPAHHATLDLVDPKDGGGAIEVAVQDSKGAVLADLLVGKLRPGGPGQRPAIYIRKAGDNQSYLAMGDLPVDTERKDWLDQRVLDLSRDRIKRVEVAPQGAPAYAVMREKPEDANFVIAALPKGREMLSENAANGVGAGAVDVTLEDVRPQSEINFAAASRITYETFDGLSVTLDVADQDGGSWVRLTAQSTDPKTAGEAQRLTAKSAPWAYAVPSWKAGIFRKPLEAMLKSVEKGKPAKARR